MVRDVRFTLTTIAVLLLCSLQLSLWLPMASASSAAGTETLVGIVGKDFVLLGADSSVSQSIALTASNLDKIAHLVDPKCGTASTILAAAAGDAADSDRLLGYLKAIGSLEEFGKTNGCDVVHVPLGTGNTKRAAAAGLDAQSMAHLARRCIWEKLRSRTPYRVCLLVAGMQRRKAEETNSVAFLSQRVQNQVQQASKGGSAKSSSSNSGNEKAQPFNNNNSHYCKPSLFWLDEYGSLQNIEYGAHGHGSNFLLSILDQHYRPDLTRSQALALMKECFEELRSRYVINSPQAPCIKCVDADGVRLM